jgi:transposase
MLVLNPQAAIGFAPGVREALRQATMADAEAICEAVTRASMRFVPTKTPEQVHPPADLSDQCDPRFAEFGVIAPVGRKGVEELLRVVAEARTTILTHVAAVKAAGTGIALCRAQVTVFQ